MLKLPAGYHGIAPDLRGYGDTEDKLIDATRGAGDWVDDLIGLAHAIGFSKCHVVGHSMGGAILFSLLPAEVTRFSPRRWSIRDRRMASAVRRTLTARQLTTTSRAQAAASSIPSFRS